MPRPPSGNHFNATDSRLNELERRMAMIDGNSVDPNGGRIGRVEATLTWCLRLLAATLVGTWATLIVQLTKGSK